MNKREAYESGFDRGHSVASWQDMPEIGTEIPKELDWQGINRIESVSDQIDAWGILCHEAESRDRDFSPFEVTAHEIDESRNPEGYWESFEEGIHEGILAYRRKHHSLATLRKYARQSAAA